jgi:hypothetical protein
LTAALALGPVGGDHGFFSPPLAPRAGATLTGLGSHWPKMVASRSHRPNRRDPQPIQLPFHRNRISDHPIRHGFACRAKSPGASMRLRQKQNLCVMMLEQTSNWNSVQRCIEAVNAAAWFLVENRCLLAWKPALVGSGRPFSYQSRTPRGTCDLSGRGERTKQSTLLARGSRPTAGRVPMVPPSPEPRPAVLPRSRDPLASPSEQHPHA